MSVESLADDCNYKECVFVFRRFYQAKRNNRGSVIIETEKISLPKGNKLARKRLNLLMKGHKTNQRKFNSY